MCFGMLQAQYVGDSFYSTKTIVSADEQDLTVTAPLTGPISQTDYSWRREIISIPPDWTYAICDPFLSHGRTVDSASYFLAAGNSSEMIVHFYVPGNSGGKGSVIVINRDDATQEEDTAVFTLQTYNTFLSTSELDVEDKFEVYPNPASTTHIVKIKNTTEINTVEILNLNGQLVKTVVANPNSNEIDIEVSDLNSGLYLVRVKTGIKVKTTKLKVIK